MCIEPGALMLADKRHLLHRRVQQDGPDGPGGDPRGEGAADHHHHQGVHPGDAQHVRLDPGGGAPAAQSIISVDSEDVPLFDTLEQAGDEENKEHMCMSRPSWLLMGGGVAGGWR